MQKTHRPPSSQFIQRVPQWRQDYGTAIIIDRAIDMRKLYGTEIAAKYLCMMDIPLLIAQRILSTSQYRRPVALVWNIPRRYFLPTPLVHSCTHIGKVWFKSRSLRERVKVAYKVEARKNKEGKKP